MDLRKHQLFGPEYYEKVHPRTDEVDYNVEASEMKAEGDIQLGGTLYFSFMIWEETGLWKSIEIIRVNQKDLSRTQTRNL